MLYGKTQEFSKWFQHSKVVDKSKQPLPVYHGTVESFTMFETDPLQKNSVSGLGQNVIGSCFSESKEIASKYPNRYREDEERKVIVAHLSIQNPKKYRTVLALGRDMVEFYEENGLNFALGGASHRVKCVSLFKQDLIKQGYDGITYLEGPPYQITQNKKRVWVAFNPEQIKVVNEIGEKKL